MKYFKEKSLNSNGWWKTKRKHIICTEKRRKKAWSSRRHKICGGGREMIRQSFLPGNIDLQSDFFSCFNSSILDFFLGVQFIFGFLHYILKAWMSHGRMFRKHLTVLIKKKRKEKTHLAMGGWGGHTYFRCIRSHQIPACKCMAMEYILKSFGENQ